MDSASPTHPLIHFENKKSEPLSGLRADAGQLFELFDQPIDGFRDIHSRTGREFSAARHAASCSDMSLPTLRIPSLTAATMRS
jgi:hypothetical protein